VNFLDPLENQKVSLNLTKKCATCREVKHMSEFNKNNRAYDGLCCYCRICRKTQKKEQYERNKDKILAKQKEYTLKNKEVIKERMAKYRAKNKDEKSKRDLEYYYANKDRVLTKARERYSKNKAKIKSRVKAYTKANKSKVTAHKAKYRAAKYNATPDWLTKEHLEQIEEFYETARDLAWLNEGEILQVDHIIPLQGKEVCGLHVPWNLQILSKSKNISKFNNLLEVSTCNYYRSVITRT
jgi:hypothetical protein